MAIGFVLITAASGKGVLINDKLHKIPEIVEHHPLLGEYDFIAKIETDGFENLGKIVMDKIRTIPGVMDTKTLMGIHF